ncbi:hypothetical protein HIM_00709 [Hirsutella minnesotensis 3608]|nr:hypothetical protein HIM_00709 [Hirsutella minnesotensis 3608]
MTESAYGRSGQTQEAQCYNCGSLGHWAVACPEPTRETPAGLAAWRNSYSTGQAPGRSTGHGSASKRSKGPIITKYTPPPPPPQLSYGSGMPPYPPPPPGAHPPGLYPGPGRPYQPYGTPPPSFAAPGYPQPTYSYHASQYSPPAPYAPPPYGQPGALGLPPAPLPPSNPFTPGRSGAHDHRLPPPPYNQSYHHPPAPYKPGPGSHSPSGPKPARTQHSPPRPAPIPSKPPATRISHPLPPKPPPSLDQMKPQRDNRNNRRKNDRQHSQDRRGKSFKPSQFQTSQSQTSQPSPRQGHNLQSPADRRSPATSPSRRRSDSHESKTAQRLDLRRGSSSPTLASEATAEKGASVRPDAAIEEPAREQSTSLSVRAEADPRHMAASDPVPISVRARSPSLNARDVVGSSANSPTPVAAASASPRPSDDQEDGEISSDEGQASPIRRNQSEPHDKSPSPTPDEKRGRKRAFDDESDDSNDARYKKTRPGGLSHERDRDSQDDEVNGNIWDSIDVPRQAERKRRGSTASKDSRHSSVSSKSSDLNSLEAELLGRPAKQKPLEASPPQRSRSERRGPSRPRRRQANTNSAYR